MFLSQKSDSSLILIIDLQSSLVRGTLVRKKAGAVPELVFSHNIQIPFQDAATSAYLIRMALHGASEITAVALQHLSIHSKMEGPDALPKHVDAVHYVLSSPWIISQAKVLTTSFPKLTTVTRKLVTDMVDAEREKLRPNKEERFAIMEEKIFEVRLNGYSVDKWEGREANDISVSYVMSIAGSIMMDKLRQACAHALPAVHPSRHVTFHSALLLEHIGIARTMPELTSYLIVHVHGELTDVVVVEHSACVFFGSFPLGVYTAFRHIGTAMKIGDRAADSLLTLAMKDHLDGTHSKVMNSAITDLQMNWSGQFTKLFQTGSYIAQLPRVVFLSARSHRDFFAKSLSMAYPDITVREIGPDDIAKFVTFGQSLDERAVPSGLAALAIM